METPVAHYNVIICGGGPAGSSSAFFLTQAGKKVLLIEKETPPRYKACGGGLSIGFLRTQFPFDFSPIIDSFATQIEYHFNGFEVPVLCRPDVFAFVQRDRFDQFLLQRCGADVRVGEAVREIQQSPHGVTVRTSGGETFTANWLIGADGANSIVRKKVGFTSHHKVITALEAEVIPTNGVMQRFSESPVIIFDKIKFGYAWIFPRSGHLSVGIACFHPKPGYLAEMLLKIMLRYGINLEGVTLHEHPLPVYTRHSPVASGKVLLVGDAAGLVDPFSGEGIRLAIKSGKIAAEAILQNDAMLYQQRIQKEIGRDRIFSVWVSQFFYRFRFLCLLFGTPNPFNTDQILDLISDRTNTAELLIIAITSLPAFFIIEMMGLAICIFAGEKKRTHFFEYLYPYKGFTKTSKSR
jgi:geranylgeranyl reductase family protein